MATRVWIAVLAVLIGGLTATTASAAVEPDTQVVATDGAQASTGGASAVGGPVKTADLSQFDPGMIISDAVFFDSGTMTEAQIQAFLEAKVPRCDSGYVCLKDWYDTSRVTGADAMCGAYSGGMRERASAIIYKVAKACGINPQVILVMLEKEQGLVRHVWPSDWRYTIAMGQGCPDTAACDTRYYGFFNQVYGAAWQLKRYANPAGTSQYFTWYAPGKTWNVRYHPEISCGSSPVRIQNQATANLYYYTPYQPNAASIRAGYGEGDGCSSYGNRNFFQYFNDWFGSTVGQVGLPFGNIELVEARPGEFVVSGWAIDPDSSEPISVHVYAGSNSIAVAANVERPDVAGAYPGLGSKHGFTARVPAIGEGLTNVCVYAINVGRGANVLMGCVTRFAMSGSPVGELGSVTATDGTVNVVGWAIDPDTAEPIDVHIYVDSFSVAMKSDVARTDLPSAYAAYGTKHGFSGTIKASPGVHRVCAYGINVGPGGHIELGCKSVTVPGTVDLGRPPIGVFEGLSVSGNNAVASGWAIDPDTTSPIAVHIYIGSVGAAFTADKIRTDVGNAYPASGANHGFGEQLTLPDGQSDVCVYAINNGVGGHTLLGCRSVMVGMSDLGRAPIGGFEGLTVTGSTAIASGWALDPDTTKSIKIHLYVGSRSAEYTADKPRPDVERAYPGYGPNHGFGEQLTLPPGRSEVCAYAINAGPGGHAFLGCRTANVASTVVDRGRAPFGTLEAVVPSSGGATISGWALDPDTSDPIQIHIYVDDVSAAYSANKVREDVGAVYGLGNTHGFGETLPMSPGNHRVCVYAINNGAGGNAFIACRDVTVP
ncbi:hypothetical protein ASD65_17110 [Microbacterium sp. Root61]|nr:hypothetical protein ASD65_17110 [Microbacterium sp. Root61]